MFVETKAGIKKLVLAALLSLFVFSCTLEYNVASEAGKMVDGLSLLVLFPDDIFLQNSKHYDFPDTLSDDDIYLLSIDSSFFLKKIDPPAFKKKFQENIVKLYEEYGFHVYVESELDSFLALKSKAYILDFSQLQIEETWKPFVDEGFVESSRVYSEQIYLNALAFEAWINISKINDSNALDNLIYCQSEMSDEIDGMFYQDYFSDEVFYNYNVTVLDSADWKKLSDRASIDFSLQTIDFIANSYIERQMMKLEGKYPERLWRYNPGKSRLSPFDGKSDYIIMR